MKAAIARGDRIVVDQVLEPVPGPGQVLVETAACGICGTDLHALGRIDAIARMYRAVGVDHPPSPERDVIFGHEFAARVLDYGPDTASRFPKGTLVTSLARIRAEDAVHGVGSSNRFPGAYAERFLLWADNLLPVPDGISPEQAAMTEPFAVGEHAAIMADLENACGALVVGCGPIGLSVIAALKARGFGPVIASDLSAGRRALAAAMGADAVIDPAQESPHARWADLGAPLTRTARLALEADGRAVIFECVGVPGVLRAITAEAPSRAQILVVGVCMAPDTIDPVTAIAKELDLRFCYAYSADEFRATLDHIARGRIDVRPAITRRIGIGGVAQAFADLATPGEDAKIVIVPG